MVRAPLFSAIDMQTLGVGPNEVFRLAATLCEDVPVVASSVEVTCIDGATELTPAVVEETWHAAASGLRDLPARPAYERTRFRPSVVSLDNRSGIFWLVGPTGAVYQPERVLLDTGAQPLMLGKSAIHGLGLRPEDLERCPYPIQTSVGGPSPTQHITRRALELHVQKDHPTDASRIQARAIVTTAESYDVLVGCTILYPMGFILDFWEESVVYRPGWQSGDARLSRLPVRFSGPIGGLTPAALALSAFSGVITGPDELLEGNAHAADVPSWEESREETVVRGSPSRDMDAHIWGSEEALAEQAGHLIHDAWQSTFVPKEGVESSPTEGPVTLSPLDTTPIAWQYPPEGICLLDLFGGISTGLAAVLQAGIPVRRYVYVERDETARRVSLRHVAMLVERYPLLLPVGAVRGYQQAVPADISLLGADHLDRVGPIDLVIAGWPCQGQSRAGVGHGLQDPRSALFWEMLRVLRHLQLHQTHPPAYILENVPLLGDVRERVVASVHQVRSWIGQAVLLDAARVGSRAHRPRLWWTNLVPTEVLKRAFDGIPRSASLVVDDILDVGRRAQAVTQPDRPPLAVVNIVGRPRCALPTFVSHAASYAFRAGGPGLVWDVALRQLVEPTADERERAMGFATGTTAVGSVSESSRRQVLGQAMDLNCLTWIVSLSIAEQLRMRSAGVTDHPLVSLRPSRAIVVVAGGEQMVEEPMAGLAKAGQVVEQVGTAPDVAK